MDKVELRPPVNLSFLYLQGRSASPKFYQEIQITTGQVGQIKTKIKLGISFNPLQ